MDIFVRDFNLYMFNDDIFYSFFFVGFSLVIRVICYLFILLFVEDFIEDERLERG